jgi:hypothetical protein
MDLKNHPRCLGPSSFPSVDRGRRRKLSSNGCSTRDYSCEAKKKRRDQLGYSTECIPVLGRRTSTRNRTVVPWDLEGTIISGRKVIRSSVTDEPFPHLSFVNYGLKKALRASRLPH